MHNTVHRAGLLAALCLLGGAAPASANTVTDWNDIAATAIVVTAGQPPPPAEISFAMVQGAVYDAVNAIDRGHRAYLPQPPAPRSASTDAAAATAAYQVLLGLFPAQQATLTPLYETSLAGVTDSPPGAKADGVAAGAAAAATMLAARKDDGRFGPFTPVYGTTPGIYRPTPPAFGLDPAPWVGNVRIGNQKPPISFEHMTSSRFLNFMERSLGFDAFIASGSPRSHARLSKSPKAWQAAHCVSPLLDVVIAS